MWARRGKHSGVKQLVQGHRPEAAGPGFSPVPGGGSLWVHCNAGWAAPVARTHGLLAATSADQNLRLDSADHRSSLLQDTPFSTPFPPTFHERRGPRGFFCLLRSSASCSCSPSTCMGPLVTRGGPQSVGDTGVGRATLTALGQGACMSQVSISLDIKGLTKIWWEEPLPWRTRPWE